VSLRNLWWLFLLKFFLLNSFLFLAILIEIWNLNKFKPILSAFHFKCSFSGRKRVSWNGRYRVFRNEPLRPKIEIFKNHSTLWVPLLPLDDSNAIWFPPASSSLAAIRHHAAVLFFREASYLLTIKKVFLQIILVGPRALKLIVNNLIILVDLYWLLKAVDDKLIVLVGDHRQYIWLLKETLILGFV